MDWPGQVALITGASSGIGTATARKLAREGLEVVLVARREERLQALAQEIRAAGGAAQAIAADLAREDERQRVWGIVWERYGAVDVLVNSAGLGWYGYGAEMSWAEASRIIAVNVQAVVHFTLLCLPQMRARGRGHIIQVGSIAGHLPSQGIALYSASKGFLDNLNASLYREMRDSGVHLSVLKPGPVSTDFFDVASCAGRQMPARRWGIRPEAVAERAWGLLQRPRRVAYVPRYLWLTTWVEPCLGWLMDLLGPLLLRRSPCKDRVISPRPAGRSL